MNYGNPLDEPGPTQINKEMANRRFELGEAMHN